MSWGLWLTGAVQSFYLLSALFQSFGTKSILQRTLSSLRQDWQQSHYDWTMDQPKRPHNCFWTFCDLQIYQKALKDNIHTDSDSCVCVCVCVSILSLHGGCSFSGWPTSFDFHAVFALEPFGNSESCALVHSSLAFKISLRSAMARMPRRTPRGHALDKDVHKCSKSSESVKCIPFHIRACFGSQPHRTPVYMCKVPPTLTLLTDSGRTSPWSKSSKSPRVVIYIVWRSFAHNIVQHTPNQTAVEPAKSSTKSQVMVHLLYCSCSSFRPTNVSFFNLDMLLGQTNSCTCRPKNVTRNKTLYSFYANMTFVTRNSMKNIIFPEIFKLRSPFRKHDKQLSLNWFRWSNADEPSLHVVCRLLTHVTSGWYLRATLVAGYHCPRTRVRVGEVQV